LAAGDEEQRSVTEHRTGLARPDEDGFAPGPPRWLRPLHAWVHRFPAGATIWKVSVAIIGAVIVLGGLLLIPLPGPGWAIVFVGMAVWATEFRWAHRLLRKAREILQRWTEWVRRQPLGIRLLVGLLGLIALATLAYLTWQLLT